MQKDTKFEIIIIGGSYAGLSAAMALGRSMRRVLIIDSGKPCNRQTPHAHNLLTHDGKKPAEIARLAKEQVARYPTIFFREDVATNGVKTERGFSITTAKGETFQCEKLLLATGVADQMPDIQHFVECWGISVLHCPYCHGYEIKGQPTGILGNGDFAFEFAKMIRHWTEILTIFTNGPSTLTAEQTAKLQQRDIQLVEEPVHVLLHQNGYLQNIMLRSGDLFPVKALYTKLPFEQHCPLLAQLGCAFTEDGYVQVDGFQKTSVPGVFSAGDATTPMRALSSVIAAGTIAGAMMNREMIEAQW